MKRHFCSVIFILLALPSLAQVQKIEDLLATLSESTTVSYVAFDSAYSNTHQKNADRKIPSASIIKVPILIVLLMEVEARSLQLSDKLVMRESDIVGSSGEIKLSPPDTAFSIDYLAREMIRISDNTATNLLINKLGMDKINVFLEENNFKETQLQRLMMDFKAIDAGRQNYTSARDISRMLNELYGGNWVNPDSRNYILELLENCADGTTIPSGFDNKRIAHKTGSLAYVRGDAGIILENNPVFISVFIENFESEPAAEALIGTISKLLYDNLK